MHVMPDDIKNTLFSAFSLVKRKAAYYMHNHFSDDQLLFSRIVDTQWILSTIIHGLSTVTSNIHIYIYIKVAN